MITDRITPSQFKLGTFYLGSDSDAQTSVRLIDLQ